MARPMSHVDELPAFARNVLRFRRHRRLSQADLAERCELSRKTISNIERGEIPTLDTIMALARGLDTSAAKLLDDPATHATLTRYLGQIRSLVELASTQTLDELLAVARVLTQRRKPAT
mgnify:CR=1 FL=1